MAYEPLSTSTRKNRNRLLSFSLAYFSLNYFGYTIEKLPLGNVTYDLPESVLPTILIISIIYLFISFSIGAYDDWKNPQDRGGITNIHNEMNLYEEAYKEKITKFLKKWSNDKWSEEHCKQLEDNAYVFVYGFYNEQYSKEHVMSWIQKEFDVDENMTLMIYFEFVGLVGYPFSTYMKLSEKISNTKNRLFSNVRGFWEYIMPLLVFALSLLSSIYLPLLKVYFCFIHYSILLQSPSFGKSTSVSDLKTNLLSLNLPINIL